MPKNPLISIPLKKTEETDWVGPLRLYITSIYGSADEYTEEISTLHRLRQDVRGITQEALGRDILYKYYGQLELLDLRIPVGEHGCKVSFTWSDALTHHSITQYSLAFEKASLLFNLASINSYIGADTDDIKVSYASFQAAAGIYGFIMENFLHAPSADLNQDTVKALSKLMLAQAQETFVERLVDESTTKPGMIAKLAKGASNLYKAAGEALQQIYVSKSWGDRVWFQLSQVKAKYYLYVANDYQSRALEASRKYGDSIAYLQQANTVIQECARLPVPTAHISFSAIIKSSVESAKHRLGTLEKDNDFIYHASIPPVATLAEIASLDAAKPTPMNELYKNNNDISKLIGIEIFSKLVPLSVHEKSSMYSEEKAKLLRAEGEKVELADEELSSALEYLDLPGSLRLLKSEYQNQSDEADIPVIVDQWATELSREGDPVNLFKSLLDKRQEVYNTLKRAEQVLDQEEREWNDSKARYGQRWQQSSPSTIDSGSKGDIQRYKSSLSAGTSSDGILEKLYLDHKNDIDVLRKGPGNPDLRAAYTATDTGSVGSAGPSLLDLDVTSEETLRTQISQTENILTKLNKISKERKTTFAEFKEKVHNDDISSVLVLNKRVPNIEETLFRAELEKFQPYQSRLEATTQHQKAVLKELTQTWKSVLSDPTVKDKTSTRERTKQKRALLLEQHREAYNRAKEFYNGVIKGTGYYSDLSVQAKSILNNTNQLLSNRQEERKKLIDQINTGAVNQSTEDLRRQLSDFSVGSNNNQSYSSWNNGPPQLPPKPTQRQGSTSGYPQQMQPYQPQPPPLPPQPQAPQAPQYSGGTGLYSTPSAYDPSFYGEQPMVQPPPQNSYGYPQQQPPSSYQPKYSYR